MSVWLFVLTSAGLAILPGPDNITVIVRSISQGTWAGIVASLGFASGVIFHTTAAALLWTGVMQQSPTLIRTVQIAGAVYLVYLAIRMATSRDPLLIPEGREERRALWRIYGQSVLMNVLNPKVTIFFVTYLGFFVDKSGNWPPWVQIALLGAIFSLCTIVVFGACAVLAGTLTGFVRRRPHVDRPLRIVVSLLFVGIAVKLALG